MLETFAPRRLSLLFALLITITLVLTGCGRAFEKSRTHDPMAGLEGSSSIKGPDGKTHQLTGRASWYGERFHGRKTASGETYDMHALTAAHKTLPFGTMVRVTDIESRKSVVVRITDRGPFAKGRVIDLSFAAAGELDMIRA